MFSRQMDGFPVKGGRNNIADAMVKASQNTMDDDGGRFYKNRNIQKIYSNII